MHYNEARGIIPSPLKKILPRSRNYTPAEQFHTYRTLRELVAVKAQEQPNDIAFQYLKGRSEVVSRTYGEFYESIVYLATYLLKRGFRGRKIALVGENRSGLQGRHPLRGLHTDLPESGGGGGHLRPVPL